MNRRQIRAIKQCGPNKPGTTYSEKANIAKALVALKRAEYVEEEYLTRDLVPPETKTPELNLTPPNSNQNSEEKDDENSLEETEIPVAEKVKALAEKHGIDLSQVKGTGQNGRILKPDVEALIPKDS